MKVAIMQPYFFPYIGYFQLINSVDLFIVYDNIKYTKKGWINRNRFLQNGKEAIFTIPLKKDSDFLDVRKRVISECFDKDKLLRQIKSAYQKAPYFSQTFLLIEQILRYENTNLFRFLYNSIIRICLHLEIKTDIKISSDITIDHNLKNQEKVLALCKASDATTYINSIGGIDLYSKESFQCKGIDLKFIKTEPHVYSQFGDEFVPWLSIIDVMMFNSVDDIRSCITNNYELIEG